MEAGDQHQQESGQAALASDLAYVRALAEEGRDTPLVNGLYYIIWGAVLAAASFIVYANDIGFISLGPAGGYVPWLTALAVGWAACFYFGSKTHAKPGAKTLGNRTARSVWLAVGIFMTGFWVTLMFVHDNYIASGVPPYFLFGLMFPIAFGVFGVAFFATATAARAEWLRIVAVIAWGFSFATAFLMTSALQILVAGIGVLACSFAPGVILMRGEPSEIV